MSVFIRRHGDSTKKYLFKNGLSGIAWSTSISANYGTAEVSSVIYVGGATFDIINGWGTASISTPIDITRFSKLKVHITEDIKNSGSTFAGTAGIRIGTVVHGGDYEKSITYDASNTTVTMDISAITGSKYISLYAQADGYEAGEVLNRWIKADKVWLEV